MIYNQETKIALLEQNQKTIMEQFKTYSKENEEQHTKISETVLRMEEKLDYALDKKAGKWVEKAIIGFIIFILTGLGGYLGTIIYKLILSME